MTGNIDYILEMNDVVVHYETIGGTVSAVNGIDIKLPRKGTLGLVGETGAGKTTTALSIMRLIPDPPGLIKRGRIVLDGRDILALPEKRMRKIRGKEVAMIFQDPMTSLNPVHTVINQIAEVIQQHEGLLFSKSIKRAEEMLELVGIPKERSMEYPHQFSGGMKQRVIIAIALACKPKLLIADEPTTALDVTIQAQVLELMKELRDKFHMSMIMITHDLGIVAETCDSVAIMYAGKIVETGTIREVFKGFLHPYTEGLFNSVPEINNKDKKIVPIPGQMPDPTALPVGCVFEPRCKYSFEECKKRMPDLRYFGQTHGVACHRYEQQRSKLKGGWDENGTRNTKSPGLKEIF